MDIQYISQLVHLTKHKSWPVLSLRVFYNKGTRDAKLGIVSFSLDRLDSVYFI